MSTTVLQIPTIALHPHPANPRRDLGDLVELADSMRAHGVRQALVAVPHCPTAGECTMRVKTSDGTVWCTAHQQAGELRVVIGHRRLAAARMADLPDVPTVIDHDLTAAEQLELMLVENVQRADLTPVEEADGYQGLLDLGISVTMIAKRTGRSRSTVERRLKLLALPDAAREKVHTHQGSLEDAATILEFADQPDAVTKLVAALGTTNFAWQVDRIRAEQREQEKATKLTAKLTRKGLTDLGAKEPNAARWKRLDSHYHTQLPKDLDAEATHFRHTSGWVYLYRELTAAEKMKLDKSAAAKARKQAREEAEAARIAVIVAEHDTAERLRQEWIEARLTSSGFTAAARQAIVATATRLLTLGQLLIHRWDAEQRLCTFLDNPKANTATWLDAYTGAPEALLLWHIYHETKLSKWDRDSWEHAHTKPALVALYELLDVLGYPISDAERARIWPTDTPVEG